MNEETKAQLVIIGTVLILISGIGLYSLSVENRMLKDKVSDLEFKVKFFSKEAEMYSRKFYGVVTEYNLTIIWRYDPELGSVPYVIGQRTSYFEEEPK